MSNRSKKALRIISAVAMVLLVWVAGYGINEKLNVSDLFWWRSTDLIVAPGSAEKFQQFMSNDPDERWYGCNMIEAVGGSYTLSFRFKCPGGNGLMVTIARGGGGNRYRVGANGSTTGALRDKVIDKLLATMDGLFPKPPFQRISNHKSAALVDKATFAILMTLSSMLAFLVWMDLAAKLRLRDGQGKGSVQASTQIPGPALSWGLPLLFSIFVAFVVRMFLTLHANMQIGALFIPPQPDWIGNDKHSILYAWIKNILLVMKVGPIEGLLNFNAAIGALTTIPLYLFLRNRSKDAASAFFGALIFAVHPVLARNSASDGQYSLLVFFWCLGLWSLSGARRSAAGVFFGLVSLGLSSAMRIEGLTVVVCSLFLLGGDTIKGMRRHLKAVLAGLIVMTIIISIQFNAKLPGWWNPEIQSITNQLKGLATPSGWPAGKGWHSLVPDLGPAATSFWVGPVLTAVFLIGCLASLVNRKFRWSLYVFIYLAVLHVLQFRNGLPLVQQVIHRAVPVFFLQCIVSGAGISWLLGHLHDGLGKKAVCGTLAASIAICVPIANLGYLNHKFVFNEEMELVRNLNSVEREKGNGNCTVLFVPVTADRGFVNPEAVAPAYEYLRCDEARPCLDRAAGGGCLYYLRLSQCCHADLPPTGYFSKEPQQKVCAAIEKRLILEPLKEKTVNLRDGAGPDPYFMDYGVIGLYRISGIR